MPLPVVNKFGARINVAGLVSSTGRTGTGEALVSLCHDKLGLLSAGRAVPHEYWKAPFAGTAMRKLLLLVLVLGILWALDTFGF